MSNHLIMSGCCFCSGTTIQRIATERNRPLSDYSFGSYPGFFETFQYYDGGSLVNKNRGKIANDGDNYKFSTSPDQAQGASSALVSQGYYTYFWVANNKTVVGGIPLADFRQKMRLHYPCLGSVGFYQDRPWEFIPLAGYVETYEMDLIDVQHIDPNIGGYVDIEPPECEDVDVNSKQRKSAAIFFTNTTAPFVPAQWHWTTPPLFP